MSICCTLRAQPANLIFLVFISFFVLLCQVLVCQSQRELKVSALPTSTHTHQSCSVATRISSGG